MLPASATTSMPCSRQASLVTGPIETARTWSSGRPVERRDEVAHGRAALNATTSAAARGLEIARDVAQRAVERHDVDQCAPAARRPSGSVSRASSARATSSADTAEVRAERLYEALADERSATTSATIPHSRSAAAVPGPIAATRQPASARASPPRRSSSRRGVFGEVTQTRSKSEPSERLALDRLDADRRALDHARAEVAKPRDEGARLRASARHGDRAAVQRARLGPGDAVPKPCDWPHHRDGRRLDSSLLGDRGDERAAGP